MKRVVSPLALTAFAFFSISFTAHAQDINVTTGSDSISCNAHISSQIETADLFFAQELITFFKDHQKCKQSGVDATTEANQSQDQTTVAQKEDEGIIDGALNAVTGLTDSAQSVVDSQLDSVAPGLLTDETCYYMPSEQADKLKTLHIKYQPITISIVNTSDQAIRISRDAYLSQVTGMIVAKQDVLSAYPLLQPLDSSQKVRTKALAGIGGAMTLGGAWQGYKAHKAKSTGKMRYIYALALGVPGLGLLYAAYKRYAGTELPLNELLAKYEDLSRQTQGPRLTTLSNNTSQVLPAADYYVIPAQSVYCEMIFVDRQAYQGANITELDLAYTVEQ